VPIDALGEIRWLRGGQILYWANFRVFRLSVTGRSSLVSTVTGFSFALDEAETRIASGSPGCSLCAAPIAVIPLHGGKPTSIGGKTEADAQPTLSPDGSEVAFERTYCRPHGGDCHRPAGIWVASTRGGRARRIAAAGNCPAWSPDGRRLAYNAADGLRLISPSGGRAVLLMGAAFACNGSFPTSWSPNARKVAVLSGTPQRLLVVDIATRKAHAVTNAAFGIVGGFAWSPDSRRLLIAGQPTPSGCSSLWIADATGSAKHLLRRC
jgi:Tol biopolymer transport system component